MMKTMLLVMLLIVMESCAPVYPISYMGWENQAIKDPFIDATETYFEIDLERNTAFIRGYQPIASSDGKNIGESVIAKIKSDKLCKEIFGFESIEYAGEKIFQYDKGGIKVPSYECYLKFKDAELSFSLADFFTHLFRKNVMITGGEEQVGVISPLHF